jgi:hypothetical protein
MYFNGKQYINTLSGRNYDDYIFYSPPAAGAPYEDALRRSMILYEQIRAFHAINTGGEVFTMKFLPPLRTGSQPSFFSGSSVEAFSGSQAQQQQQPATCVDSNTAQQNWYLSQVIDTESKRNLQRTFCENAGLRYDPLQCGLRRCLQPVSDMTSEAGSDVSAKYNYNESRFNATSYPKPADNTQYQRQLGDVVQLADIDQYYKMFNQYNFYWRNQEGWRQSQDVEKPYNPPIASWIKNPPPAATGERAFLAAVAAFNTNARTLIARLNSYESVSLPADFGEMPEPPPYPNVLHDILTRPRDFLPAQVATNLPAAVPGQPEITYQIPQRDVASVFNEVTTNPPPPAPPTPERPPCNDLSGGCLLYDDEVNPFARKALDEMRAKAATRISSAGITYAMDKPRVPDAVMGHKFRELYDNVINDVIKSLPSIIQSSKCS